MACCCAFCGAEIDPRTASPGSAPGLVVCPTCGQEIDGPTVGPAPGGPAPSGEPGPPPVSIALEVPPPPPTPAWEGEGGVLGRLWRTVWQILLHPGQTLATPAPAGKSGPLGFALIVGTFGLACQGLWGRLAGEELWSTQIGLWLLALAPLLILALTFLSAWLFQFGLWMVNGNRRGPAATFRYCAYSQATGVFNIIPVLGPVVGGVWSVVLLVVGLAGAQGVPKRQVISAVLVALMLAGLAVGLVAALVAGTLMEGVSRLNL